MDLRTLASGSSGNCLLLSAQGRHILVDAGISCRRITKALAGLSLAPKDLSAIFITHEHSDHIAGLSTLTRHFPIPIYTSPGTARQLCYRMAGLEDLIRPVQPGESLETGPFGVSSFPTSHDAAEPMGFVFAHQGRRAAVVTDLGVVTPNVLEGVLGAHLVVCEANHDMDLLRSGPYPYPLKARILGDRGHLSNEAGADLAGACAQAGARTILLSHLSQQNNTPALALRAAQAALRRAGVDPDRDVTLAVSPRSEPSIAYEV